MAPHQQERITSADASMTMKRDVKAIQHLLSARLSFDLLIYSKQKGTQSKGKNTLIPKKAQHV